MSVDFEWDVLFVEETMEAEMKAHSPRGPELPPAPYSWKMDLVIKTPPLEVLKASLHGNFPVMERDWPADSVINVSHKTEGSQREPFHRLHHRSIDTLGGMIGWNDSRHLHFEGPRSWPCVGTIMNCHCKAEYKKDPDRRKTTRFFVDIPPLEVVDAFREARQVDWYVGRWPVGAPHRSRQCINRYGRFCDYDALCAKHGTEAFADELLEYEVIDKQAMLDPPSPYGASRYDVMNRCDMLHHLSYDLNLVPLGTGSFNMSIGSAFHLLLAATYRGHSTDEERRKWRSLPVDARRGGLKHAKVYADENLGGVFRHCVAEEDELAEETFSYTTEGD